MESLILLGAGGMQMTHLRWYQYLLSEQTAIKNHMKFRGLLININSLNLTSKPIMLPGIVWLQLKQLSYLPVPQKNMLQLTGKGGSMLRAKTRP
eukprot:UN16454